jgi:metal-responsive CopG/Arc/MetJ family transcriptional regulator
MNLNITVPDHLVATADKLSKRMGVSRNELFRLALTQLLEELQSDSELVAAAPVAADDDEDW